MRTKSTPAGETLEARVTKRNGQTTTKNEPINRSKNNKNNNPSNKSPREIEGVPCIASTIPNIPNNPLLASSNLNNSNSNNIDQFIQRLRAKYNLVRTAQMPIDVAMGLVEGAEAKNCYPTRRYKTETELHANNGGKGYQTPDEFYDKLTLGNKESTMKYINKHIDKGTSTSPYKSAEYHLNKHGKGLNIQEYIDAANYNFKTYNNLKVEHLIGKQRAGGYADIGWKIESEYGWGVYTKEGKILTFIKY